MTAATVRLAGDSEQTETSGLPGAFAAEEILRERPGAPTAQLTAEESVSSPNVPLADLVATTLETAGRSPNTRRAYRTAIGLFLQFLERERGDLLPARLAAEWCPFAAASRQAVTSDRRTVWHTTWTYRGPAAALRLVDARLLDAFRQWRMEQGDAPNAVNARVYAVQTLLRIALDRNILSSGQGLDLRLKAYRPRQPREEQAAGRCLEVAQVRRLRAACATNTVKGKRDLAILDMMLYAGLDAHEVAALQLGDLQLDGSNGIVTVTGRGRQARSTKVHPVLAGSLRAWLEAAGLAPADLGYVFRGVDRNGQLAGDHLSASAILRLVGEYGQGVRLVFPSGSDRLTVRDLRCTCARNAYDNGAKLASVQAMLGHNDPKTTVRYIGAFDEDVRAAVDYVRY